jgi:NAD(P)-dependent dehydrogenase (short-subunit alcohol dehydrogenase family)
MRETLERFGRLDCLVANAGTVGKQPITEMSLPEWHRVLQVNLDARAGRRTGPAPGALQQPAARLDRYRADGRGQDTGDSMVVDGGYTIF